MTDHGTFIWNEVVTEDPGRCGPYITVDDADAAAAAAERLGGTILEAPRDIPDVGRIAMFSDHSGAPVHVMQPARPSDTSGRS